MSIKLGIDFDGTITAFPELVAGLMKFSDPKNCYIITARCPSDKELTVNHAANLGITPEMYNTAEFFPEEYDYKQLRDVDSKDLWARIIKYKCDTCKRLGIDVMLEDDPRYKEPLESIGVTVILMKDPVEFPGGCGC